MSEPNPGLPEAPQPCQQQPGPQYPVPQQPGQQQPGAPWGAAPQPEAPWGAGPQPPAPWGGAPQPGAEQPPAPPWGETPWSGGVPPQYGYQVPPAAYPPPGYGSALYSDPLVTAPGEGYSGWAGRVFGIARRNWRRIVAVTLLMQVVPVVLTGVLSGSDQLKITTVTDADGVPHLNIDNLPRLLAIALVGGLIGAFLREVGTGAIVWSVTREAVGRPAPFGEALGYGFRNGPRLFGWGLLYGLLTALGVCACIVGMVYPAVAGCLYAPVALYQRGSNAIGTSFSMVNRSFWPSLGRMATVFAIAYAVESFLQVPALLVAQSSPMAANVLTVVFGLIVAPVSALIPLGSVVLFAELRARIYPLNSADLAAAL